MILVNDLYTLVAADATVMFETAVTIKEVKHTAQLISSSETDYKVVVFKGDVAKSRTKTLVVAQFEEYGEANRFLSELLQAASRGDSIKPFTVKKTRRSREYQNTFPSVFAATQYYGYTLLSGASWQHHRGCVKVNQKPKTASSLVTALNNAVCNTQGSCYAPDHYELV